MDLKLFEFEEQLMIDTSLNIAIWQLEKSKEVKETETTTDLFFKNLQFLNFEEKIDGL